MRQQLTKPAWYRPLNLIIGVLAVLVATGAILWATTDGFGTQLEPKSSSPSLEETVCPENYSPSDGGCIPRFVNVTVTEADELPVTTPSCMQNFGVAFTGRMTSETIALNGVTFNRNAERTVVDVPVELGQPDSITVDGMYVHVMVVPAAYKISYFFPRDPWGEVQEVSVCFA